MPHVSWNSRAQHIAICIAIRVCRAIRVCPIAIYICHIVAPLVFIISSWYLPLDYQLVVTPWLSSPAGIYPLVIITILGIYPLVIITSWYLSLGYHHQLVFIPWLSSPVMVFTPWLSSPVGIYSLVIITSLGIYPFVIITSCNLSLGFHHQLVFIP